MKKLYLSITLFFMLILMFVVTMIPTQAYTYDDPVANQGVINIDTPLTILNNNSLRDVYELGNLYNYNNVVGANIQQLDYTYELIDLTTYARVINSLSTTNAKYYMSFDYYLDEPILQLRLNVNNSNIFFTPKYDEWTKVQYSWINTYTEVWGPYFVDTGTLNNQYILLNNALLLDVDYLGIDNLTDTQIDYFYQLYQILRLNLDPSLFYLQGYDDGEDFGYLDGYNDGLVEGYYDGNSAYHQGIYEFDYLTGVPYLEGLETGYNNGVDYAVQENISILSIFELIFGVALNMLTFIITIDIFGISILSLISVLSLFVGVVWILKMIRG